MPRRPLTRTAVRGRALGLVILSLACGTDDRARHDPPAATGEIGSTPPEYAKGASLFAARCAVCHGEQARGSDVGPPLVHPIYEPGHHSDAAFYLAVANGVRAHHWRFGDMQPVSGLIGEQVKAIVGYVRWLQREAGIS